MTKFPHELPRPTSLITPPVYHSRPPIVKTEPRFSDNRSNNGIHTGGKPTAGFRCRAVVQLGNSVNLGISVGGNIGKDRGDDESHTLWHTHIGDKGSQTVIRSGDTTLRGAQMIGKGIRADSRNPSQSVHGNCNRHRRLFRQPTPESINIWTVKKTTGKSEISQTEYDSQIANRQYRQVLFNSIAAELSAPTQSAAGMAAATASPMISYKIEQYFKSKNTEGSSAHLLAHAVLGAAVAAAGDNTAP